MPQIAQDSAESREIDERLASWRQGDVTLDDLPFIYIAEASKPLTTAAAGESAEGKHVLSTEAKGFVVLTQTCDIVRYCTERPFLQLSPLRKVEDPEFIAVQKARIPRFAYIPGTANLHLVADLDRVMTVEKSVLAFSRRLDGCTTDSEARDFARALARKHGRFAFPDDFNKIINSLRDRIVEKSDKNSPEGRAIRALREIRVRAAPSWNAETVEIMIWFVREAESDDLTHEDWANQTDTWTQLISSSDRFRSVSGLLTSLADLTALDYVESDPLDLDQLSVGRD